MSPTPDSLSQLPSVVAVVDDDASVMNSVRRWLDMRRVASLGCSDADGLLEVLVQGPDGWRVQGTADGVSGRLCAAIIDLNLPGMSGFDLASRLLQVDPALRVVVITAARWQDDHHVHSLPPGVSCLSKPFRLDAIESLVLGPSASLS